MICYYLRWFRLPCCSLGYELLRGVDVLFRGHSSSFQPQEAASHPVHPIVVSSEGFIPFWKDVFHFHPFRQSCFLLRLALPFLSCCLLLGRWRVWTLVLQALLPVLGWFTSWCRDSLRLLDGEVAFISLGDDDLSYLLQVRLRRRLILMALSLVTGLISRTSPSPTGILGAIPSS